MRLLLLTLLSVTGFINAHGAEARFLQDLKAGKKITIVTLGTSLTAGQGWPSVMMSDWLNKDFPGLVTLQNLGVSASASSHPPGNSGLDKVKLAVPLHPDVVFIEFGTNDAYLPYRISLADSKKNLTTIIDTLRAANPKVEIILQTMNSCKDKAAPSATQRPQMEDYFQGYRDVARARFLPLVDNYPAWLKLMKEDSKTFDQLVPDGLHPLPEGNRQVVLPVLKKTLLGK